MNSVSDVIAPCYCISLTLFKKYASPLLIVDPDTTRMRHCKIVSLLLKQHPQMTLFTLVITLIDNQQDPGMIE